MRLIAFFLLLFWLMPTIGSAFTLSKDLKKEMAEKRLAVQAEEDRAAVEGTPVDPFVYFDLAMTYAYSNKIEEGWELLKKVNELDKTYAKKMISKYTPLVEQNPTNWKNGMRLSFALFFDNQKEAALALLKSIEEKHPNNIWALAYQSLIHGEAGNVNQAIIIAKRALKIDNEVSSLHYLLGTGYIKKGWQLKGYAEIAEALRLKALGN